MFLEIVNLNKSYHGKVILKNISLNINRGELISIVGPSGAGKTTLLKIISGIESPDSGKVDLEDSFSSQSQPILVFQDYVLFPNMTIFENIAFGLRARKLDGIAVKNRVNEIMSFFKISSLSGRYPSQISAGEKQRTAIARALVLNPPMILLDEPFANLDKNLKFETAEFIRTTQKEFGITTVSVTHDLKEAFMISDRIGVMINGEIVQYDTPAEIYRSPAAVDVAALLGDINILPAAFVKDLCVSCDSGNGEIVCVRPESVKLEKSGQGEGIVVNAAFAGHYTAVTVKYKEIEFRSFNTNGSFVEGERVRILIDEIIQFKEK
jgi:putative spermidine/putrescine transport system ATP-binding protein